MKSKRNTLIFLSFLLFASTLVQISSAVGPIPDTKEKYPSWSPDGQRILFFSTGVMSEGIFIVKPDGTSLIRINPYAGDASWSLDGAKIILLDVFSNKSEGPVGIDIVEFDLNTKIKTRLTFNGNSLEEIKPKYSHDGNQIVFRTRDTTNDIYVMNSDGSDLKKIVESASNPDWSPDGKKIVYYVIDPESVWVINPDGTGNKLVYRDYDYSISRNFRWTSDSKYLLLNNRTNIITGVNIDDPTDIEYIYDPVAHWDPGYSPDGNYVTFVSSMDGGNPDLFVARSNGSNLHRLVYDTNPQTPFDPSYFSKINRPAPPPWPMPEPTPVVTSTAEPVNTTTAEQTPSIPGFSALAVFMILVSLTLIKRKR